MPSTAIDTKVLLRAASLSLLIEVVTLPIAILTMGHAGPDGRFAELGWLALLINLPGFLISGGLAQFESQSGFALCVFSSQMVLFTIGFYLMSVRRRKY